jgi:phage terminase small subunit
MAKIRPPAPNKKHRLHARLEPEQVAARVAQLRAEHPHLQPRDEPLLRMLAVAYIKLEAAYSYQATTWYLSRSASGILNAQRFEAELRRTEERALSLAKELRLTPAARAGLEDPGGEDALAVIRRKVAVGGEDGHGDG